MAKTYIRYEAGDGARWALRRGGGFHALRETFPTTGALVTAARQGGASDSEASPLDMTRVRLLAPITANQQFLAQATNYRSHVIETGGDPDAPIPNAVFGKASSSLSGAHDPIRKPARVKLLDYEVELGLVIGAPLTAPQTITPEALGEWLGALVIVNDVSARDIQVPEGQYLKGKSFRSFSPAGPHLVVLEPGDAALIDTLELSLWVNDALRQNARAADMIHKPHTTLSELSEVMDLHPGDLIITGTPGGVALTVPNKLLRGIGALMAPHKRFEAFIRGQMRNPAYLKPGDLVRATIKDPTGHLDLGEQSMRVEAQ